MGREVSGGIQDIFWWLSLTGLASGCGRIRERGLKSNPEIFRLNNWANSGAFYFGKMVQ